MADVLDSIPPELCVQCKAARGLCGISPCPLLQRVRSHLPQSAPVGRDLFGSSPPSVFVGRHGYPHVAAGPMLPAQHLEDQDAHRLDDPRAWLGMSIADVVGMRSSLVRTTHKLDVRAPARGGDRILDLSQELAISARPVDTEVRLDRVPRFGVRVGEFTAPHGPVGVIERARLTENVRVETPVERATSDTDVRAAQALWEMYRAGTDPYQMERILSAGMVGQARARRLVPTRWAITATDDTLGKALMDGVHDLPAIDKPVVHQGEAFGNRFHVVLLPGAWGFELIESWQKGAFWARGQDVVPKSDFEDHRGRTAYAANTAGGYYATRLPVLQHMHQTRRRATAIVLREITDAYTTPLGVWVVREACRTALESTPLVFEDAPSAVHHVQRRARLPQWSRHSRLWPLWRTQKTLDAF